MKRNLAMANRMNRKRASVMIVAQDFDFGIKLADWLAAHGYQAVLVRSAETAIDECRDLRPQAVFIGLPQCESAGLDELLRLIETTCPCAPVVIMGDRTRTDLAQVMNGGAVRHFLIQPTHFRHIGHVLRSELSAATASLNSPSTRSVSRGGLTGKNLSRERAIQGKETSNMDLATCYRCHGLMYPVDPLDPLDALRGGEHDRACAWRCVTCGDLIDPIIMQNRLRPRRQRSARQATTPRQPIFKDLDS